MSALECLTVIRYFDLCFQGRKGLGNIYVWASGDGGEEDDCNCDGYAASMWTISINSAINDGQNAHYDESCSSTLASTFSNGAKDPNTGVVSKKHRPNAEIASKNWRVAIRQMQPFASTTAEGPLQNHSSIVFHASPFLSMLHLSFVFHRSKYASFSFFIP